MTLQATPDPEADQIIWSITDHLSVPPGPLAARNDDPLGAALGFLSLDGRARRYLARHPQCQPDGCTTCSGGREPCQACRVANWARLIVASRRGASG